MKSLLILGRQPALGLAELESLYGSDKLVPFGKDSALLDIEPAKVAFTRLGGSVKLAEVLQTVGMTDWRAIEPHLESIVKDVITSLGDGKIKLGLSAYGISVRSDNINRTSLSLKKAIKASGRSVRVVPNKFPALNSAQVLHNQLTGDTGIELVIARHGTKTIIARTRAEQDIEAYASRDQGRPKRDAKVGMLPPKLAQIIINLAGNRPQSKPSGDSISANGARLLDPFCGTGVLLQEAQLMGYNTYGTDVEPRMIEYSEENLAWLNAKFKIDKTIYNLEVGDATTYNWKEPIHLVACETYLGKPLTSLPPRQVLDQIMRECDEIHDKFLRNIGSQLTSGTHLCLAMPAWRTRSGFLHLKTLANLDKLGYTRKKFVHVRNEELIYHRPDQTVARELVVLEKK